MILIILITGIDSIAAYETHDGHGNERTGTLLTTCAVKSTSIVSDFATVQVG